MSREEVERLLGPPIRVEEKPPQFHGEGGQTLVYFRRLPLFLPLHYPKLWVHLRDGRVEAVYAKRQDFLDDEAVYALYRTHQFESAGFREIFPSSKH